MLAGGTSRKSTDTSTSGAGTSQPPSESTTPSVIVVPGAPEVKLIAVVPCPESIDPPVSVQASAWPGPDETLAERPPVSGATDTGAVIEGAGNGQSVTVVCTCTESLPGFGSRPVTWTRAFDVSVPTAPGVPTISIVAEAPLAMGPRSQAAPCASTLHEPWLGVAESTVALSVRPSETWTSRAAP